MARKADTPCAGACGKLLWRGTGSKPPGEMMCRPCRGKTRTDAVCAGCSTPFVSVRMSLGRGWTQTCGNVCASRLRWPDGPDIEKARARYRKKNHERRSNRRAGFDKVLPAHELALRTKAKRCPLCKVRMTDTPLQPTSKELDHIVPLNVGGTHTVGNVRIICRACNVRRPRDGSDYVGPVTLWAMSG